MTAEIINFARLLHPAWCNRDECLETDGTDTWYTHSTTIEEPIAGTDRCIVVWIDQLDSDEPSFTFGSDRLNDQGYVSRYDGLPEPGLSAAEATALTKAMIRATTLAAPGAIR